MPASIGQDLLNAPFPDIVKNLGVGIAEAQYRLDQVSILITQLMAGFRKDANGELVPDETQLVKITESGEAVSLLALGFTPTFYQYVDTVIELKMAITITKNREFGVELEVSTKVASINAAYSQKYQYSAEGSSSMKTKLVTVPAPTILEERIRRELVEVQQDETGS